MLGIGRERWKETVYVVLVLVFLTLMGIALVRIELPPVIILPPDVPTTTPTLEIPVIIVTAIPLNPITITAVIILLIRTPDTLQSMVVNSLLKVRYPIRNVNVVAPIIFVCIVVVLVIHTLIVNIVETTIQLTTVITTTKTTARTTDKALHLLLVDDRTTTIHLLLRLVDVPLTFLSLLSFKLLFRKFQFLPKRLSLKQKTKPRSFECTGSRPR